MATILPEYKVKSADIKRENFLTDEQIADIPIEHVYAWVRQGMWKPRDFHKWLKVIRVVE